MTPEARFGSSGGLLIWRLSSDITRIEPTLLKLEYCCCCCCPSQFSKLCCWGGGTSGDKLDSSCWISHSDSFDWSSDQILTLLVTRNTPTSALNPHHVSCVSCYLGGGGFHLNCSGGLLLAKLAPVKMVFNCQSLHNLYRVTISVRQFCHKCTIA